MTKIGSVGIPDVIYPMKALDDDKRVEKAWDDDNYWAERKYDGARYLVHKVGGKVTVTSRQQSKQTGLPVDKTENVPHLVAFFERNLPDGTILDGEIIIDENSTSSEVTKIMGAKPDKAITRQKESGWVNYVVFDMIYYDGKSLCLMGYANRRMLLEGLFKRTSWVNLNIFLSPVYHRNKREVYETIVNGGGEGIILKHIDGKYVPDKRPVDTWLKVKKEATYDVVVMGYTEATMEYSGKEVKIDKDAGETSLVGKTWAYWWDGPFDENGGGLRVLRDTHNNVADNLNWGLMPVTRFWFNHWIGAVVFGQYKNGILTEIGQTSGFDDALREEVSNNKEKYLGKVMELQAMEQIKDTGALRHPRFKGWRTDKNPEDCVLGEC